MSLMLSSLGAIKRHKSGEALPIKPKPHYPGPQWKSYNKISSYKYIRPGSVPSSSSPPAIAPPSMRPGLAQTRDVVIDGVAFETSQRSLVRKDLPKTFPAPRPQHVPPRSSKPDFVRTKAGHLVKNTHMYKAKPPSRTRNRNMTLNNTRRPYQSRRVSAKRYVDKPCPRFTTTGACNRGLTCPYQHDPSKIAICWPFLQGSCPHSADTCPLSHNPTPHRTPLCVHFANNGRCTRSNCPFPHVRVGPREGVCRDFAVLGYCDRGIDCDRQHVRECPDFAEHGTCETKGCKLPHVIRANRNRKATGKTAATDSATAPAPASASTSSGAGITALQQSVPSVSAEDAEIGDEYISLTFNESESDESDEDDEEEEEEEEGESPNEEKAEGLIVY
ncbi:hypothetical protein EW146_g65 [Bondarzewia mesenterica]|uniref:C3H1-type domain-containing protein n=1 Tax=Bondarzewia mesenterica TaxID=1095465 RepID=A0A4S4M8P7_9AGAM|nr:hypothetical protein EW146_g65 [Bondarzewia mesenterica]